MHLEIRIATHADALAISNLVCKLSAAYIGPHLYDGGLEKLLASMDLDSTTERIESGWPHFCACENGELIGIVVVKPQDHLYHLFVDGSRQMTGLGQQLFQFADQQTVKESGMKLRTVNSSINAVGFYRKLGFSCDGDVVEVEGVRYRPMVRV